MMKQPCLQIKFESGRRKPASLDIVAEIKEQIKKINGVPGLRLPPVRVLAHQLGISKNTVQRAYDELVSQGIIESRERTGLFVSDDDPAHEIETAGSVPLPELHDFASPGIDWSAGSPEIIRLSSVFIDPKLLPISKISECFRSVLRSPGLGAAYSKEGYYPLRKKIAERLKKYGIETEAENIITTLGSQQAIDIYSRVLKRKVIATENPTYFLGKFLLNINRTKAFGLRLNPFTGIPLDEWESLIRKHKPGALYLIPKFQNPTGYSYSTHELHRIIDLSKKYDFGIIEDDWGSDMLSFSEFRPSIRAMCGNNVVYLNTFTKKLLPSLRLGYVVGNEKTTPAMLAAKTASGIALPTYIETTLFEFLDRGYYDTHLKKLHSELDRRYILCLDMLRKLMPEDVRWTMPGGGPVLWLELSHRIKLDKLSEKLRKRKILINTNPEWFYDKPHLHGFCIGYTYNPPDILGRALEIVADEIRKMK